MGAGLIGGILGGIADVGKIIGGFSQNHEANQINPVYRPYEISPYAKAQLGLAQQLFNGRMFGASALEQNIANSQANYMANVGRNATDSSQALALGALSQGQTNNAYNDLQIKEAQNKYDLLGNLNTAEQGMTAELDKQYQDMLTKYMIDTQQKAALKNSAFNNIFSGFGDISGGLIMGGDAGWFDKKPSNSTPKVLVPTQHG